MAWTRSAMIALLAATGAAAMAGTPPRAIAAEGEATVADFLKLCSAPEHRDSCSNFLAEYILDSRAPCVPNLDQVLAEMRKHPEWATLSWTAGVDAAGKALCSK